jgi:hypothetical protein
MIFTFPAVVTKLTDERSSYTGCNRNIIKNLFEFAGILEAL